MRETSVPRTLLSNAVVDEICIFSENHAVLRAHNSYVIMAIYQCVQVSPNLLDTILKVRLEVQFQ